MVTASFDTSRLIRTVIFIIVSTYGFCLGVTPPAASAADQPSKESQVKAAYIYNITKFVNWPLVTANQTDVPSDLNICFIGNSEIQQSLKPLESLSAQGKALKLTKISDLDSLQNCQLIYLTGNDISVKQSLSVLKGLSCLTIGDGASFIEQGGMIGFTRIKDTIRLKINLTLAKSAGIDISANLLEVAESVQ